MKNETRERPPSCLPTPRVLFLCSAMIASRLPQRSAIVVHALWFRLPHLDIPFFEYQTLGRELRHSTT